MKKFVISLDGNGLDELIKGVEQYQKWLEDRTKVLVQRLTDMGVKIAETGFASAVYDGTNDVKVDFEERGETTRAVIATGNAALFIEFGTGIMYPDNHPEQQFARGSYGKGQGKQRTWGYYGEPGTNGRVRAKKNGGYVVTTHGNPANMCMYNARKQLEEDITRIAREVFGN